MQTLYPRRNSLCHQRESNLRSHCSSHLYVTLRVLGRRVTTDKSVSSNSVRTQHLQSCSPPSPPRPKSSGVGNKFYYRAQRSSHIMSENQYILPRKFKFFRVLLPGFSRKLSIPQKFTKYFVKENSTWATILSPLGKSWNVKISGDSTSMHFEEGWERFAVAHKLGLGDFLVFKYVGGLVFDVAIFDRSTCERDYSVVNGIAGESAPGSEENYEKEFECYREQTTPPCGKTTASVEHHPEGSRGKEGKQQVHMAKETTKVCERTSCFVVKLSPKHKSYMEVPSNIIRSNDLSSIHQMLLKDPQGDLWPVKLLHKHHASQNCLLLSTGWRDFRVGNNLENGDVCIFELKMKNEMLVQIHRRGNTMTILEDGNRSTKRPLHGRTTVQLKQPANLQKKGSPSRGTSEPDPYFKSTIFLSNLNLNYLYIPKAFLSSVDLSAEREAVLVDPNSRQWPVKILSRKCGRAKVFVLGRGWLEFCHENNLDVGDVCIFSFKSQARKATFHVEVFKSETGAH